MSAGTSLASYRQMVTETRSSNCPEYPLKWLINVRTGQTSIVRCRRNSCPYCLPRNARLRAMAITLSAPERMIRLSLVANMGDPDPLETARIRIKRIREALREQGVHIGEWCWTLEQNPNENGYHAHALQHGPYIPQATLQDACHKAKAGLPDIRRIKRTPGQTARYGLKGFGADGYGLKKFRTPDDAMFALYINHNRLEHHTRAFFRVDGTPTPLKVVEREAISRLFPAQAADHVVCSPSEARRYLTTTGLVALARLATRHAGMVPPPQLPEP